MVGKPSTACVRIALSWHQVHSIFDAWYAHGSAARKAVTLAEFAVEIRTPAIDPAAFKASADRVFVGRELHHPGATGAAAIVAIVGVTIIAAFVTVDGTVAASREGAGVAAVIVIDLVAVIAGLKACLSLDKIRAQ